MLRRHKVDGIAPVVKADFVGGAGLKDVGGSGSEILNGNRKAGDVRGDYRELADIGAVFCGVTQFVIDDFSDRT